MGKVRVRKKNLAIFLTSVVLVGSLGKLTYNRLIKNKDEVKVENENGYDNINPILNFTVDDEDFVILDIGNHHEYGTYFQNMKMKKCNDNDISLGVIISTDAQDEASIYDDVEYVKSVLAKHTVDFPVYLDINTLMEDNTLNTEMKTKIAKDFLEKCASNDIYVGVYGTDTNLCRFKKYCNISSYDAFLVMDQEKIQYDGTYYVVKDLDGNIKATTNLASVILKNGNNTSDGFVQDGSYTVKENDDLVDIALQSGMSVDELLEFNDMRESDIEKGSIIRFPSVVATNNKDGDFLSLSSPLRGCDLSYAQGSNINWDKIDKNFDFIIVRCAQGTVLDSCFENNIKNCNTYGIPVGVYCYNGFHRMNTSSIDEFTLNQEKQADFVLDSLKNKKIDYPVYLDVELLNGTRWKDYYNSEYVSKMLDIWEKKMRDASYVPGLYCNQSGFRFLQSCVDYDLSEKFELWVAGGEQYTAGKQDIDLEKVSSPSILENNSNISMAQATDSAVNAGAGNKQGHLDVNFSLKDYTKNISDVEDDLFDIKEFRRIPTKGIMYNCGALTIGLLGAKIIQNKGKRKVKKQIRGIYL